MSRRLRVPAAAHRGDQLGDAPLAGFRALSALNPVFAALTGLVILDQSLAWLDWLAIVTVVMANGVSVSTGRRAIGRVARPAGLAGRAR
jgi:inner membrane transporter RhtA